MPSGPTRAAARARGVIWASRETQALPKGLQPRGGCGVGGGRAFGRGGGTAAGRTHRQTDAAAGCASGRGRSGPRGGAEACALLRPPPPAARAQPAERREPNAAAAERGEGEAAWPGRIERNPPATGSRRQDAPAHGPFRRQPPPRPPAARAPPGGAAAAAGAGGGKSEQEPRAPECWVSAAVARGRREGGSWAGGPLARALGGEGLSAVGRSWGLSEGPRAPLRTARPAPPNLGTFGVTSPWPAPCSSPVSGPAAPPQGFASRMREWRVWTCWAHPCPA